MDTRLAEVRRAIHEAEQGNTEDPEGMLVCDAFVSQGAWALHSWLPRLPRLTGEDSDEERERCQGRKWRGMPLYKGFISREATRRTQEYKLKLGKKVRACQQRIR
eukprot:14333485-Alexandrium_andersonii.AAC.1